MNVKLKVGDLIERRNMTQTTLAELTGIRPSAISDLCRNRRDRVQLDHLAKIAAALDVKDIRELIDIEDGN
ncbi:helix-turn-helix transcriptional regulator [Bacillus safensis]